MKQTYEKRQDEYACAGSLTHEIFDRSLGSFHYLITRMKEPILSDVDTQTGVNSDIEQSSGGNSKSIYCGLHCVCMDEKVIVISCVGSGGANNLIRSIRASSYENATIVGLDANEYLVNKSLADKNYVVPTGSEDGYIGAVNEAIQRHDADLFIPQHESEIRTASALREELACPVQLPEDDVVDLCLDKFVLNQQLDAAGYPVPTTVSLGESTIEEAFEALAPGGQPVWCRTRYGSSGIEAQPVQSPQRAAQWVEYWNDQEGVPREQFTLSEFLPGRDFHVLTFWHDGELILGKGNERNQYFFGENTGIATPLVGRQLYDEQLNEICTSIVEEIAPNATGNFGFDFREAPDGTRKLTEINIGKFSMVNYFFNMSGEFNMAEAFLDAAFGNENRIPSLEDPYSDVDTDLFLSRGIDLEPEIFNLEEIEGVEQLGGP